MSLNRGQKTLLLMFGITLAPILAAQAFFHFWRPAEIKSYGELIATPDAAPANGYWRLVAADPQGCTDNQKALLFATRQMRLAQGQESHRIQRGSTVACPALDHDVAVLNNASGLHAGGLYLIDPHGNLVMRYRPEQIGDNEGRKKAMAEIGRILKNNEALG
ncbi:hypothetical protein [Silvimonas iriomotensis]|uniref:Transmembrane protein n=1 Tax=Silvimonas iriomotensis TaxID=449662 RepID=A0ABQ2PE42_9NEIS|nr:hypothetical protein [Silvimonas iriomotensis]GGP23832.1 hypothetical protein GCM10010970_38320 [Silvimonas iriomotensis]